MSTPSLRAAGITGLGYYVPSRVVTNADLEAVRAAGYGDAEIVEIVVNVALNLLTNYVNNVAQTEVDFPAAQKLAA